MITRHFTTGIPRLAWLAYSPTTPDLSALTVLFVHGASHQAQIFLLWLNRLEQQGITANAVTAEAGARIATFARDCMQTRIHS